MLKRLRESTLRDHGIYPKGPAKASVVRSCRPGRNLRLRRPVPSAKPLFEALVHHRRNVRDGQARMSTWVIGRAIERRFTRFILTATGTACMTKRKRGGLTKCWMRLTSHGTQLINQLTTKRADCRSSKTVLNSDLLQISDACCPKLFWGWMLLQKDKRARFRRAFYIRHAAVRRMHFLAKRKKLNT